MTPAGSDQKQLTIQSGSNTDPAWSPRGTQLAYTDTAPDGTRDLFAIGRLGGDDRQLTFGGTDQFPAWSPDGSRIVFARQGDLYTVSSSGATSDAPATLLTSPGVDPVWAPVLAPTATKATGNVTVKAPGSSTMTISTSTGQVRAPSAPGAAPALTLTTGTVVNAVAGSVKVDFKPQSESLQASPSTALVTDAAFTVAGTNSQTQTLILKPPACGVTAVTARRHPAPTKRETVRIKGRFRVLNNYIGAGASDPAYAIVYTCQGTQVKVTSGAVIVTLLHGLPAGADLPSPSVPSPRRPIRQTARPVPPGSSVRVPAGQSFFVAAAPAK